jgi:hypothetical protein
MYCILQYYLLPSPKSNIMLSESMQWIDGQTSQCLFRFVLLQYHQTQIKSLVEFETAFKPILPQQAIYYLSERYDNDRGHCYLAFVDFRVNVINSAIIWDEAFGLHWTTGQRGVQFKAEDPLEVGILSPRHRTMGESLTEWLSSVWDFGNEAFDEITTSDNVIRCQEDLETLDGAFFKIATCRKKGKWICGSFSQKGSKVEEGSLVDEWKSRGGEKADDAKLLI